MEDFQKEGFIEALTTAGTKADLIAVDAHFGYYKERTLVARLREDVIGPALAGGHDRIWLVGVSMGGFGSLLYADLHSEDVAGLVLFSPFLGEEEVIEEIRRVGGLRKWSPAGPVDLDTDYSRELWRWLKENVSDPDGIPIYLGYGARERLATANSILADILPSGHVRIGEGGHRWETWSPLWTRFVEAGFLCR
jgi:pimeloyl-ACP methyl ester carboxylesterase